jgi:hypothetical protein
MRHQRFKAILLHSCHLALRGGFANTGSEEAEPLWFRRLEEIARSSKVKTWKGTIYMVYQYIHIPIYIYTLGMYTCMYVDHAYGIYYIHNHNMMVYIYTYRYLKSLATGRFDGSFFWWQLLLTTTWAMTFLSLMQCEWVRCQSQDEKTLRVLRLNDQTAPLRCCKQHCSRLLLAAIAFWMNRGR